jgi:uncharacterized protein (TIGR03083 family)
MRGHARALAGQRQATLGLLGGLAPADWDRPCLPPWRVREVVAHLVTVDEAAVTGRLLPVLRSHGREEMERWNDAAVVRLAALPPDELVERLERWGVRLGRIAGRLPRILGRVRVRTAFGRQPLGVLLCRRIVDEWVHTVDIGRTVGAEAPVPEGVAEALATGVLDTLPALVLPRLDERAGVVRLVVETGASGDPHGPRRTWGVDLARRQYGPRVTARPDATVRLPATTLALLTEGRLAASAAAVDIDGDEALAVRVLERLRP